MDVDQSRIDPDYRQSCKHNKYQLGQGPWRLLTNYLADVTNLLVSIFTIECFVRDPRHDNKVLMRAENYDFMTIMIKSHFDFAINLSEPGSPI